MNLQLSLFEEQNRLKTCKTCNGPLVFYNPHTHTYQQAIAILRAGSNIRGVRIIPAATHCQRCASSVILPDTGKGNRRPRSPIDTDELLAVIANKTADRRTDSEAD